MSNALRRNSLAMVIALTAAPCLHADQLTVRITNIETAGELMLQLFADEIQFNGEEPPLMALRQQLSAGDFSFKTSGLASGDYGLRLMYDTNGNGELDTNVIGMPTEPWGFSNNATGSFGPPGWSEVKFTVTGDTHQAINLNR